LQEMADFTPENLPVELRAFLEQLKKEEASAL
jgi:hypothetical protein